MTKFSDFIRAPGTAGPPTVEGIYALGFALRSEVDPVLGKTVRVDEAQSFDAGEQAQGRENLDAQEFSASLTSLAGLTTAADRLAYTTAANTWAVTTLTAFARTILDDPDASALRTTLGLGSMAVQNSNSVAITGGSISGVSYSSIILNGPTINTPQGEFLRGYVTGLAISNNGGDANNDIDIATGSAGSDGATPVLMTLSSALTKRLDANWAVGNNQGGLDTGTKQPSTWYYLWIIQRSDTGVVDVCYSASATSPTIGINIPGAYDRKRRIPGAVRTDGSGNIRAFRIAGRSIFFTAPIEDLTTTGTRSLALLTLTVPPAFDTVTLVQVTATGTAGLASATFQIGGGNASSPPTVTLGTGSSSNTVNGSIGPSDLLAVAGQIYFGGGNGGATTRVFTHGFTDILA